MVPVWIALLFLSIVSLFLAIDIPRQKVQYEMIRAEHDATSFLAYRKGIIDYLKANPTATGHIDEAALSSYWPQGYSYDAKLWSNYVDPLDKKLYIFSLSPPNNGMQVRLASNYGNSFLVGSSGSSGKFFSTNGKVSLTLPTAAGIKDGVVVMIGR